MRELKEYAQRDAQLTREAYLAKVYDDRYRRKYKRAVKRVQALFLVAMCVVIAITSIYTAAIKKETAAPASVTISSTAQPSASTAPATPSAAPQAVKNFPFTASSNNLNTLPVLLMETREQIKFTYDTSIPLSASLQYWISGLCYDYGIDPYLVYAIIQKETSFGAATRSADGKDYGIMQIREINHKWLNGVFERTLDFDDDYDNTMAGIYMLNLLINKYAETGVHRVLMSYNMGESGARKVWNEGQHSSDYSNKVLEFYDSMKGE